MAEEIPGIIDGNGHYLETDTGAVIIWENEFTPPTSSGGGGLSGMSGLSGESGMISV